MASSILIIQGHPDPERTHLCHALGEAYAKGAQNAGHHVECVEVAQLNFPLLRSEKAFETEPVPETLADARDKLLSAGHVVIIYPLWLGGMPALLKGFLEQLLRPGVVYDRDGKGGQTMALKGRSARVIVTMGMPALAYRFYFFAHSLRALKRNILRFVGFSPVRDTVLGMVGNASEAKVKKWLAKMEALGAKAS